MSRSDRPRRSEEVCQRHLTLDSAAANAQSRLLLYGSLATGFCYLIAAVTLKEALIHPENKKTLGSVTTAMFFLYYFTYGTSFAKVPWVFNSEINSLGWRARGAAAATATNWMGGFIVVQFTKTGVNHLGWSFYLRELLLHCICLRTNRH